MKHLGAVTIVCSGFWGWTLWGQATNVFPASGNVGIGTTSPSFLLNTYNGGFSLDNDGNYSPIMARTSQNNVNANYSASIIAATGGCTIASPCEMNTSYGSYFGSYSFRATANLPVPLGGMFAQIPQTHTSSSRPVSVYFSTTPVGSTSAIERIRIDQSGNVGIGTATPVSQLHVRGSDWNGLTLTSATNSNKTGTLKYDPVGTYVTGKSFLILSDETTNTDGSNGGIMFRTNSGSTPGTTYPAVVVRETGNVGIGTINPQHLLHVAGTIGAEEVIVSSSGADYVFDPGHRLTPLSEVAGYINEHHHLPDIPSASEMQQKGAGIGDMQAKLLAKIEELTLHMIQAEERSNHLEQENGELRKQIREIKEKIAQ